MFAKLQGMKGVFIAIVSEQNSFTDHLLLALLKALVKKHKVNFLGDN